MPLPPENIKRIEESWSAILLALGEDPSTEHFQKTPTRIAEMYSEVLDGNFRDRQAFLDRMTSFEEQRYTGVVAVHGFAFYSFCAHHGALFQGHFSLGYLPTNKRVLGLSKLVRIFREGTRRLTTQESITQKAVDTLREVSLSNDVICHVDAVHTCMTCRGVQAHEGSTVTEAWNGEFENSIPLRQQFLNRAILRAAGGR